MLEIKITVIEMRNGFHGLTTRLNIKQGGISASEDRSVETSQTEMQRKQ